MDLYQLKTFVAVAREGSITRASELVHLSQPAVSAHIKALEETLRLALFERTPRGMSLTRHGQRLLAKAEQTLLVEAGSTADRSSELAPRDEMCRMPRSMTLLFLCVFAVHASARDVPPNPTALQACALARKPKEPVEEWVKRGLEAMSAYAVFPNALGISCEGIEPVKCPSGPHLLRSLARGKCALADAWEWGAIMGQPVEETSGGWRLRAEPSARTEDWMLTEGKRLRELLGNTPTRIVTTQCASKELEPERYRCLLAELPKAMTLDDVIAIQSKVDTQKLRIEEVWPAGKPDQGLFRVSVHTSCRLLGELVAPDATTAYEAAQAAAKKSGFSPVVASTLRVVVNVHPDDRRDIVNGTAREFGFTGDCWPRAKK